MGEAKEKEKEAEVRSKMEIEIDFDVPLIMANGEPMEQLKRDDKGFTLRDAEGKETKEVEPIEMREQIFGILMRPRPTDNWTNKHVWKVHTLARKIMKTEGKVTLTFRELDFLLDRVETEDVRFLQHAHRAVYVAILDSDIESGAELPRPKEKKKERDRRE